MVYNQDINLDLNTNTSYVMVGAKQGDNISRTITATILENGKPFYIPETATASYRIHKTNNEGVWNSADIYPSEHKVIITLTSDDLSISGRIFADILLTIGQTRLGTASFIINVQPVPNIANAALQSDSFSYLSQMIDQANEVIESAQAWAEGKRGTEEVLGDSFVQTGNIIATINTTTFKENIIPSAVGKTIVYKWIYTDNGWEYQYNHEITDLSTIGLTVAETPEAGDFIELTASFQDPAWHNNAKWYADLLAQSHTITDVVLNADYTLTFTFSDGTGSYTTPSIRGEPGQDGTNSVAIEIGTVTQASSGNPPSITPTTDPETGIVTLDFVLPTGATVTIDDSATSGSTTWSSTKINNTIQTKQANLTFTNNNGNVSVALSV